MLSVRSGVNTLLWCCCILLGAGRADDPVRISGRLTDAATGLPLPSVNVFLSGTTWGTISGPDGRYAITNALPGHFRIVASKVGYMVASAELDLRAGTALTWDTLLTPRELKGAEVEVVAASPTQWRSDLASFRREFLGAGLGADSSVLENPEILDFQRNESTGILSAASDQVLRIRNGYLGYRLEVNLLSFAWDSLYSTIDYRLYVRFRPLRAARAADSLRWREARSEAYRGSLRHFLTTLVRRRLAQEGFYVTTGMGEEIGTRDLKIHLTREDGVHVLATEEVLIIDYGGSSILRRNFIRLAQGLVHLRPDASLVEQDDLRIDPGSYWATQRVGSMLPLDYIDDSSGR